jgi:hypothetical protein
VFAPKTYSPSQLREPSTAVLQVAWRLENFDFRVALCLLLLMLLMIQLFSPCALNVYGGLR